MGLFFWRRKKKSVSEKPVEKLQTETPDELKKAVSTETSGGATKPDADMEKLEDLIRRMVQKMLERIREEVPESGVFQKRSVTLLTRYAGRGFTDGTVRELGIIIEPDEKVETRKRMLAAASIPGWSYARMAYFVEGTNQELMEYLSRPEFYEEIKQLLLKLDQGVKKSIDD